MKKRKNRKKILIVIAIIVVVGIIIIINLKKDTEKPLSVKTAEVKPMKIVQSVNASGALKPVVQVRKSAKVSARIINITIKEGDVVNKGDLLVELDRTRYEAAHEQALSNLKSARANYKKVKSELKRTRALYQNELTSDAELEAAQAQTEIAASQVEQAEASLKQVLDDLEKTRIVAPMDGTITNLRKEIGEMAVGSTFQEDVILVISDMSRMEVEVEVDETDVIDVSLGDTAKIEVDAIPDEFFTGVVSEIAHSATVRGVGTQEQVTNFDVIISVLEQDERFRPGMSATVDIITEVKQNVLGIPIQALTVRQPLSDTTVENNSENPPEPSIPLNQDQEEEVVFIVQYPPDQKDGAGLLESGAQPIAKQQAVEVGISSESHFEVLNGLSEGDMIVIGPYKIISTDLKDGKPLKISSQKTEGERK